MWFRVAASAVRQKCASYVGKGWAVLVPDKDIYYMSLVIAPPYLEICRSVKGTWRETLRYSVFW